MDALDGASRADPCGGLTRITLYFPVADDGTARALRQSIMKNRITPRRVFRLTLTGALLGLGACASSGASTPVATASTTSATVPAVAAQRSEISVAVRAADDEAGDDPRGILVVHDDVVAGCPGLKAAAPAVGKMAWLGVMRAIASCVKDGTLKDRTLVLNGPSRPQVVVKYIFARLGVPEQRVQMSAPDSAACASDCTGEERRIEIGLGVVTPAVVGSL
jgi:hypothetical protein